MISIAESLAVGLVPLGVALVISILGRRFRIPPGVTWSLALAVAYAGAFFSYHWQSRGPAALEKLLDPRLAQDWLLWAAVAAALVAIVGAVRNWRMPVVPVLAAIVCGALPTRLLWESVYVRLEWSTPAMVAWLSSLAVALWLVWMTFHTSSAAADPRTRISLILVVALTTSLVLAMSGVLVYGLFVGSVAAALVGTAAVPILLRDPVDKLSAGLAFAGSELTVLVGGLIMLGYFFAELTATNAILLTIGLGAAAIKLPALISSRPKASIAIRAAACLVPTIVAATLAAQAFAAAMAERSSEQQYW